MANRKMMFEQAALVLADDAIAMAERLKKNILSGQSEKAEAVAANLQRVARDAKWLTQRIPKD